MEPDDVDNQVAEQKSGSTLPLEAKYSQNQLFQKDLKLVSDLRKPIVFVRSERVLQKLSQWKVRQAVRFEVDNLEIEIQHGQSNFPQHTEGCPEDDRTDSGPLAKSEDPHEVLVRQYIQRSNRPNAVDGVDAGFPAIVLREILMLRNLDTFDRPRHIVLVDGNPVLLWSRKTATRLPRLVPYGLGDPCLKAAWAFQLLVVISWFHSQGLPYQNVIVPDFLAEGTGRALMSFLPISHYLQPSRLCMISCVSNSSPGWTC